MRDVAEELLLQKHERKIGVWKASSVCYILPLATSALSKNYFYPPPHTHTRIKRDPHHRPCFLSHQLTTDTFNWLMDSGGKCDSTSAAFLKPS